MWKGEEKSLPSHSPAWITRKFQVVAGYGLRASTLVEMYHVPEQLVLEGNESSVRCFPSCSEECYLRSARHDDAMTW